MNIATDLNLSLMASARAIVEARRGPMPPAPPEPGFGYGAFSGHRRQENIERIRAYDERTLARRDYHREVVATFRSLKADVLLAPVVALGRGVMA